MSELNRTNEEADAINEQMARQIAERRDQRPERRQSSRGAPKTERRRICSYCFQPGDHPTPHHCLRALER
jgi:hypothetical protein